MLPRCIGASRATILLWDDTIQALTSEESIGAPHPNENLPHGPQRMGFSISGLCFSEVRPVLVPDCTKSVLIPAEYVEKLNLKCCAAVPIAWKQQVLGVLRVDNTVEPNSFTGDDIEFLTMVSEQLGMVIQNTRLIEDLRRREHEIMRVNAESTNARDSAVRADRAKSDFLARVSHELRTPMNAILGYAEMLTEELGIDVTPEQAKMDLGKIRLAGKHVLELIDDLLDLARIEAGKVVLRPGNVCLRDMIDGGIVMIQPLAETKGNQIVIQVEEPRRPIVADETKLRQILLNLLSNACKFTQNGVIQVRAWCEELNVGAEEHRGIRNSMAVLRMSVSDTGKGIPESQMKQLFDSFYQVDLPSGAQGAFNSLIGGYGLGLAISRQLARLMGGDITVSSQQDAGTKFLVELPVQLSSS